MLLMLLLVGWGKQQGSISLKEQQRGWQSSLVAAWVRELSTLLWARLWVVVGGEGGGGKWVPGVRRQVRG
jgi:hypothetical protein